jgi:AraC-like DNA-binding protein
MPRVHWAARTQTPSHGDKFEDTTREINFAFVQEGEIKTRINDIVLTACAQALLVYPAKTRFAEEIGANTRYLRVFFVPGSTGFDDSPRMLPLSHAEMAARWLNDLCVLHERHDTHRALTSPLLEAIIVRLTQIEQRQATELAFHPSVVAAMKYLEDNLAAAPTLRELATHTHMSGSHLRELFRCQVGSSPSKYQNDLRMQRALRLLEQPHLTLPQIARACGFSDPEYFARRFRQYHHLPPGQLRRRKSKRAAEE